MLVGLDEDVGGVGIGQAARASEVGIDGHVAEVGVPLAEVERSSEDGGLAAGVYCPVGVDGGG